MVGRVFENSLNIDWKCLNLLLTTSSITWINSYLGFPWKIGKVRFFILVFSSPTWFNPISVWKNFSSCTTGSTGEKTWKTVCFLDEGPSLLESWFEVIPSSHFVTWKNRIPWLLTALHLIKAQNAPDFTQNIYTYL